MQSDNQHQPSDFLQGSTNRDIIVADALSYWNGFVDLQNYPSPLTHTHTHFSSIAAMTSACSHYCTPRKVERKRIRKGERKRKNITVTEMTREILFLLLPFLSFVSTAVSLSPSKAAAIKCGALISFSCPTGSLNYLSTFSQLHFTSFP